VTVAQQSAPSNVTKEKMPPSTAALSTLNYPEAIHAIVALGYANGRGEAGEALVVGKALPENSIESTS
jgi:hypothetical protein